MSRNRPDRRQQRGRKRLTGKVLDNIESGTERLIRELGIRQEPCTAPVIETRPQDSAEAGIYALAGMAVIFVIAATNCPLLYNGV